MPIIKPSVQWELRERFYDELEAWVRDYIILGSKSVSLEVFSDKLKPLLRRYGELYNVYKAIRGMLPKEDAERFEEFFKRHNEIIGRIPLYGPRVMEELGLGFLSDEKLLGEPLW